MSSRVPADSPTPSLGIADRLGPLYLTVLLAAALSPGVISCTTAPWWMGFDPSDFALNIAAFLPIGWMLQRRSILAPILVGLAIPLSIEVAQRWLFRTPTPWDLGANFLGTLLGYILARHFEAAAATLRRLPLANPKALSTAFAIAVFAFIAIEVQRPLPDERLLWPSYPLVIGNEAGGDRAWNGKLYSLAIFDTALNPKEASTALNIPTANSPHPLLYLSIQAGVVSVETRGLSPYTFTNASLPPSVRVASDHLTLDNAEWHLPAAIATTISTAITSANHLTIIADLEPATDQPSQGRILTLSNSPNERAFTLGTKRLAPVFRFRTEATGKNGQTPQLIASDSVLHPNERITLCAHFDGAWSRLYARSHCVANAWFPHWHGAPGVARNLLFTLALLAAACSLLLKTWLPLPRLATFALACGASFLAIWTLELCHFIGFRWQVEGMVVLVTCASACLKMRSP